jgi:methylmalonyl-CoA/ethylmalonyl-CoA epimerase
VLYQVALHADDVDRARAFYETHLGASFLAAYDPPGLMFLRVGSVRLLFEKGPATALLYHRVDDVHDKVEELRAAGVEITTEPHVIFSDEDGTFGPAGEDERMAFFRDSEGNLVGLVSRHAM